MINAAENFDIQAIWANTPISVQYPAVSPDEVSELALGHESVIVSDSDTIQAFNAYYRDQLPGTHKEMRARRAVVERLMTLASLFAPMTGLFLFDLFRTRVTQAALFENIRKIVINQHPQWSPQDIEVETLKFVAHPYDTVRVPVPPHNSGGAVDLGLYDVNTGENWDFGTEIDTVSALSATEFFEQDYDPQYGIDEARWLRVRLNRRTLFNAMKSVGFVSLPSEWWHYDLGNRRWANSHHVQAVFESME